MWFGLLKTLLHSEIYIFENYYYRNIPNFRSTAMSVQPKYVNKTYTVYASITLVYKFPMKIVEIRNL